MGKTPPQAPGAAPGVRGSADRSNHPSQHLPPKLLVRSRSSVVLDRHDRKAQGRAKWSNIVGTDGPGGVTSPDLCIQESSRMSPWPPRGVREIVVVLTLRSFVEPPCPPLLGNSKSFQAWTSFKLLSKFGYPSDRARRKKTPVAAVDTRSPPRLYRNLRSAPP